MKSKITLVVRLLLGLLFVFAGVAGLFNLIPTPPDLPENLKLFNQGLAASIYFMPFLKIVETICGILLITNFFVPLALVMLAPIVINIFLVHAFIAPDGVVLGLLMGIALVYLAFFAEPYKVSIRQLFKAKA